jgi:hypothetical protein
MKYYVKYIFCVNQTIVIIYKLKILEYILLVTKKKIIIIIIIKKKIIIIQIKIMDGKSANVKSYNIL